MQFLDEPQRFGKTLPVGDMLKHNLLDYSAYAGTFRRHARRADAVAGRDVGARQALHADKLRGGGECGRKKGSELFNPCENSSAPFLFCAETGDCPPLRSSLCISLHFFARMLVIQFK